MMSRTALTVAVCVLALAGVCYGYPRQKLSMDFDWRFHFGDIANPAPVIDPNYDDSQWRQLNVPHDFVVEGKFDPAADEGHGYLFPNISWYRHKFVIPTDAPANTVWWVTFDGVYRDSTVYLNGHNLGTWASGYVSFRYNLTSEYLAPAGEENVLVVRVDATYFEGWWYEGGGIYRHVWLEGAEPLLVAPWGVFVRGEVTGEIENLTADSTVMINTTVWNMDSVEHSFSLVSTIYDATGAQVATVTTAGLTLGAGKATEQVQSVSIESAALWSIYSPSMYSLVSQLVPSTAPLSLPTARRSGKRHHHNAHKKLGAAGEVADLEGDSMTTPFGVRKLTFDVEKGFFLNDEFVKVKGMCNHADFGGTGTAMPKSINKFRLQTLMDYGVNALRASHNAQDPDMLDMADQLGLLVWNEERLYNGISDITLKELNSLLIRDRNHPSVFMWSLCNEYSCGDANSFMPLKQMVKLLDGTRPVTAAMNHGWYDNSSMSQILDVVGFNYNIGEWNNYHTKYPTQPLTGSETSSAITTRGIYTDNATAGWLSAYDVHQPGWGNYAWKAWQSEDEAVYMEGGFVWTGFDYKGEPTPYAWPCINSHFGMIDIVGFPKDNAFYYQAWWKPELPMVHILPHWTWPDKVGQSIDVWVYTSAPFVELFLNGKSLGVQAMQKDLHAEWHVTYAPGTLSAKAYDQNNNTWATSQWQTAGEPAAIELSLEKNSVTELVGDGSETALVTVKIFDANGIFQPVAANLINFTVEGAGTLLGVGNGNPSCHDSDKATFRYTFGGLARALIQSSLMQPGDADQTVTLTATSAGLKSASITLTVHAPESLMIA